MVSQNIGALISIIVPVYNVAPYIDECVLSIVNQDYNNIEIILINDGSTDDSLKKCMAWAMKDKRICCYNQSNRGLSATRNKGVELALGEYVSFIDPDDTVEHDFISVLYNSIIDENSDVSIVYLDTTEYKKNIIPVNFAKTIYGHEAMNLLCNGKIPVASCVKLYRIDLLRAVPFIEGLLYEDFPFVYQIISRCSKVAVCNKTLYHYRVRSGSITQTASKVNLYDYIKAMNLASELIRHYYSEFDYRYIKRVLDNWCKIECLFHMYYKKILNRDESFNIKREQSIMRKCILSNISKENIHCFPLKTKMRIFIIKYVPYLYYPFYKAYHNIESKR